MDTILAEFEKEVQECYSSGMTEKELLPYDDPDGDEEDEETIPLPDSGDGERV